jgi:uncharacterized protein YaeQ
MALKATIYKAHLQIADMDRSLYADHAVTLARHPSETDERMMVRLLAFALQVPTGDRGGTLEFAKDLWDVKEAALWQHDETGVLQHWIDVGQPDDRRLLKAGGRSSRVSVYSYTGSTALWWRDLQGKVSRMDNLTVWQIDPQHSQSLAHLAARTMQLQVTVQEGTVWLGDGNATVELSPQKLR